MREQLFGSSFSEWFSWQLAHNLQGLGLLLVLFLVYFYPSFSAWSRKNPYLSFVVCINLFFGWSLIGRVAALILAGKQGD